MSASSKALKENESKNKSATKSDKESALAQTDEELKLYDIHTVYI